MRSASSPAVSSRVWLGHALALVVLTYLAHFLLSGSFGLYEDDYWSIAPWLGQPWSALGKLVVTCFETWPQGRPLNHCLPPLLAALGYRLDGLPGIYLLGFIGLSINVLLVYRVAWLLFGSASAFLAGFFYVLYPADTTREFLTHCGHIQPAMTFFLLGALLLLREKPVRYLAYPVAFLSLLSYETAYLLFIFFPLLQARPTRRYLWRLLGHGILCALTLLFVAVVRLQSGEVRMVSVTSNAADSLHIMLISPFLGFATSAAQFVRVLPIAVHHLDLFGLGIALAVAALAGVCFKLAAPVTQAGFPTQPSPTAPAQSSHSGFFRAFLTECGPAPLGYMAVLLLLWLASYLASFLHFPPTIQVGRLTSVHAAAAFPASLLLTQLCLWAFAAARHRPKLRLLGQILIASYCGLLGAYTFQIQQGYAAAWAAEKSFWSQVFALCPELQAGVTVIVQGQRSSTSPYIDAFNIEAQWISSIIFNHRNSFDDAGHRPPPPPPLRKNKSPAKPLQPLFPLAVVIPVVNHQTFPYELRRVNADLYFNVTFAGRKLGWSKIDENNLICLRLEDGHLTRVDQLSVPALPSPLRTKITLPPNPDAPQLAQTQPLFKLLTD